MNYNLYNEKEKELDSKKLELELMENSIPDYLSIDFVKRRGWNKVFRVVYLIFRVAYVTVWFYFLPIIALLYQFIYMNSHY